MEIDEVKEKATPILRRARVKRAAIFGSVARGESDARDVDLVVEMSRPYGLFKFLSVKGELEDALKRDVDMVEYSQLKPGIREKALKDAVQLI